MCGRLLMDVFTPCFFLRVCVRLSYLYLAYEIEAGVVYLQVKLCDSYLSASSESLQERRCINPLTFTFYLFVRTCNIT